MAFKVAPNRLGMKPIQLKICSIARKTGKNFKKMTSGVYVSVLIVSKWAQFALLLLL
jgi:hypothetical protein